MLGSIKLFSGILMKKRVCWSFSWYSRMIFLPGNLRVCSSGIKFYSVELGELKMIRVAVYYLLLLAMVAGYGCRV